VTDLKPAVEGGGRNCPEGFHLSSVREFSWGGVAGRRRTSRGKAEGRTSLATEKPRRPVAGKGEMPTGCSTAKPAYTLSGLEKRLIGGEVEKAWARQGGKTGS